MRTALEDTEVTELLRTFERTVNRLAALGVDASLARPEVLQDASVAVLVAREGESAARVVDRHHGPPRAA